MAGAWQGQYKYLLGFLIVLVSGMAAGVLGKLSGWRHLSTCSVFWPFFYGLGNWLRNYSVSLPFEIPHYTYRRHTLATIDRVSMLSLTTLFCLFFIMAVRRNGLMIVSWRQGYGIHTSLRSHKTPLSFSAECS